MREDGELFKQWAQNAIITAAGNGLTEHVEVLLGWGVDNAYVQNVALAEAEKNGHTKTAEVLQKAIARTPPAP